jgi:hypothetical protein
MSKSVKEEVVITKRFYQRERRFCGVTSYKIR